MSVALIVGSAQCLAADLAAFEAECGQWNGPVIACNDQIALWPGPIAHGVTQHPERMNGWREKRTKSGFPDAYEAWTIAHEAARGARIDRVLYSPWQNGTCKTTSAVVAVQVALKCYGKAVLVGCPLDAQPRVEGGTGQQWTAADADGFREVWVRYIDQMIGKVRSMSGWTEQAFGRPTREWLEQAWSPVTEAQ